MRLEKQSTCKLAHKSVGLMFGLPQRLLLALNYPDLPFLAFLDFLACFVARNFLVFLGVFPFFLRDFRDSEERKILVFLGGFPCFFQKSKERKIRVVELTPVAGIVIRLNLALNQGLRCGSLAGMACAEL